MSELTSAIKQVCDEKGLSYDSVIETIESALSAAYRKDFGERNQNIKVEFDPETGKSKVYDVKIVVEDMPEEDVSEVSSVAGSDADESASFKSESKDSSLTEEGNETEERKFNPRTEIQIGAAKEIKKTVKVGEEIKTKLEAPDEYGRMAAQTAKQVIIQKLREAERNMIFDEFKDKENEVVSGVVQRREGRVVLVDLGKAVGILPPEEQIYGENYSPGARIKIYVKSVNIGSRGPEIILSRVSDEILKKVFYLEIPEISNGLVELKAVAREAGARSKVAVSATGENIDPIGSCVGQRGARIQTIISELGGEKVDIIEYDDTPEKFIANALSPAKTINIELNKEEKRAKVTVQSDQLSLAIGRGGQNVRLAAQLTGWKIDIAEAGAKISSDETVEPSESSEIGEQEDVSAKEEINDEKKNNQSEEASLKENVSEKKEKKTAKKKGLSARTDKKKK